MRPGLQRRQYADRPLGARPSSPPTADLMIQPDRRAPTFLSTPTGKVFVVGGPQGDAGPDRPAKSSLTPTRHRRQRRWCLLRQGSNQVDPLRAYAPANVAQEPGGGRPGRALECSSFNAIGLTGRQHPGCRASATGKSATRNHHRPWSRSTSICAPRHHRKLWPCANLPQERGGRFYQDVAAYGPFSAGMI